MAKSKLITPYHFEKHRLLNLLLNKLPLNQKEISEKVKIDESSLSNYINGNKPMGLGIWKKIKKGFPEEIKELEKSKETIDIQTTEYIPPPIFSKESEGPYGELEELKNENQILREVIREQNTIIGAQENKMKEQKDIIDRQESDRLVIFGSLARLQNKSVFELLQEADKLKKEMDAKRGQDWPTKKEEK